MVYVQPQTQAQLFPMYDTLFLQKATLFIILVLNQRAHYIKLAHYKKNVFFCPVHALGDCHFRQKIISEVINFAKTTNSEIGQFFSLLSVKFSRNRFKVSL